ncbi:extracellular solute-binding protein [Parapedobacter indicus]|uniref:Carbohydrate ABC transporter substrate-binding protein, CUT1 family n=1 Tax=Parapedobacter indicus TaxID=1477437 RepID=A0A1I3S2G5_9SPHI|nr:extracellular solute-binding protein [Parapedobacter indicus]PPK99921.1 multiple sugar transport system substrate-binding protein [Parapedobacter indicus]SFJ51777.1 carbohydrate ABC transporter substrate-binding protein, CUT1 family [Parapedobacter indicus]
MKKPITLRGITWNHSRGYTPLVAAAQRYGELHPEVSVTWDKRTLQEFADAPLDQLVPQYDLLIIDHPWVGRAAAVGLVLPLDSYLSGGVLRDQARHSVGFSHASYQYDGHQWALAIDAATPVASYRKDLLDKHDAALPTVWDDVLSLAKAGKVAVPSIPIDLLMYFYTFCLVVGQEPFLSEEEVVGQVSGIEALELMRSLWCLIDQRFFEMNPIRVAECMTAEAGYWYCPFSYGYSNYARTGYAANVLAYTDVVGFGTSDNKMRTTLGGTGLAVSATSRHQQTALDFATWITSGVIQSTLYAEAGGQPGHRSAWENERVNLSCNHFFKDTLPALDRAYVRPRYNGYLSFQDRAGEPLQRYLRHGGDPTRVLTEINTIYRESRKRL